MKKIAVIGSINIDYFVESERLPKFGETVIGESLFMSFGGKGANQAVAASRLGGDVTLFGSIGNDYQKSSLINLFREENIDIDYLHVVNDVSTGAAFIQLHHGENRIIIVPGANKHTNVPYIQKNISNLLNYDIFLFQMEVPLETLMYIIPLLNQHGKTIILDPAPAQVLGGELLEQISYLTPNEHEFAIMFDQPVGMEEALKKYPNKLIITCGEQGAKFFDGEKVVTISARKAEAIDTTGAGDTFAGAFTVAISEGKSLEEAVRFGNYAASIAITKKGAQSGMPYKEEIENLF